MLKSIMKRPRAMKAVVSFITAAAGDEEALPRRDDNGRAVTYQEWDVNRHVAGVNRGAERLITGSDGAAYYTSDHYRTFTKIR